MATLTSSLIRETSSPPSSREILRCRSVKNANYLANLQKIASPAELKQSLFLLDVDEDGKLNEDDVDILLQLALGVDARRSEGTWPKLKAACTCADGALELNFLINLVGTDLFDRAISQMDYRSSAEDLFPFTSIVDYIQVFRDFDRDRNGLICAADLQQVINAGIVAVPRHHCKEIIRRVDPDNQTGVVNLLNFGKLISHITSTDVSSAEVKYTF